MRRTLLVAVALAALSAPAMAQGYGPYDPYVTSPRVDQRQSNQAHRIQRGQWDGSISPREADRLWQGQQKIHRMERNFEADGRLSRRERAILEREQDRQNRRINRQRNDHNWR